MKTIPAGLLAAGLLALDGRAEPGRPGMVQVGAEWLVESRGEVAVREVGGGWRVVTRGDEEAVTEGAATPSGTAARRYPMFLVAGAEPSPLHRRIVTGQISVRLREVAGLGRDEMGPMDQAAVSAAGVAAGHDMSDEGVAEGAAPWRLFRADPPARALEVVAALRADPRVVEAQVVVARQIARRGLPNDPLLAYQWHLKNAVPTADGGAPVDVRVDSAWGGFNGASAPGWRGRGVRLGIIDDGIDYAHPEFVDGRLDAAAGRNWNNGASGNAAAQGPADSHGTAVAGLAAAAADNAVGVAGVAPAAGLVSLRLTAGAHDDVQEAQAIGHLANTRSGSNAARAIDIKNASWGPMDGAFRLAGPGPLARQALAVATRDGRGGRGTVFVWAAGNGGALGEDANADGYANNPHVIAVGAMDSNGRVAAYSESGACLAVVAPSNTVDGLPLMTSDRSGPAGFNPPAHGTDFGDDAFTLGFGGTSAAAPLVAGVCALMLEANPQLGWRDVKEILLRSARRVNPDSPAWFANAVGLRFHPRQGAGLVDAAAATSLAATWTPLGQTVELRANARRPEAVPDGSDTGITRTFDVRPTRRVEHALLRLSATHPYRGDLRVTLTSPGGTTSVLAPSYFTGVPAGQANYDEWVFSTLHFWGEPSQGTWTLRVADVLPEETGRFLGAELTLLAAESLPEPVFTSPAARTATVGEPFAHVVTAAHGPIALAIAGTLPPGLEFDEAQGTLHGWPARAGNYAISFHGTNAKGTTTQSFELTVVGLYQAWMATEGVPEDVAGPTDDPDADGWPNLFEYAAGGRAMVAEPLDLGRSSAGPNAAPAFFFRRLPTRSDVAWQVEHSGDGAAWSAIAESLDGRPIASLVPERFAVDESPQPDNSVRVGITDTAFPAPSHGWFRLRISLEP